MITKICSVVLSSVLAGSMMPYDHFMFSSMHTADKAQTLLLSVNEELLDNESLTKKPEGEINTRIIFSIRTFQDHENHGIDLLSDTDICRKYRLEDPEYIFTVPLYDSSDQYGSVDYQAFYSATVHTDDIDLLAEKMLQDTNIINAEPDHVWNKAADDTAMIPTDEELRSSGIFDELNIRNVWQEVDSDLSAPAEGTVVAVIDTGVDYTHSDLEGRIWINQNEIPDNGIDDDHNGYTDDVYGYDYIEDDGYPTDDNGHGTHVAGIIAMNPGNGGGVGLAYGTKIMVLKAGQPNGTFSSVNIAKAIQYASANGADVINMSFTSKIRSPLVEAALQDSFSKCVLVAAAGNNKEATKDSDDSLFVGFDYYPAAYDYVIGVMAADNDGNIADYSNWDYNVGRDGEYEIAAPGNDIYSTLPDGRYAYWSGTSMAAPTVSAAAAILRSQHTNKNKYPSRYIMGQLIGATASRALYRPSEKLRVYEEYKDFSRSYPLLNIHDSLTRDPEPFALVDGICLFDDPAVSPKNNGDGIARPGETIDIGVSVRNRWGKAKNVTVGMSTNSEFGLANSHADIIRDTVSIGNMGSFSTNDNGLIYEDGALTGVRKPLRLTVRDNTSDGIQIGLNITLSYQNGLDENDTTIYGEDDVYHSQFTVQNGHTLSGKIRQDMTLTADKKWIIDNTLVIPEGVTVTAEPGTNIQFGGADSFSEYGTEKVPIIMVDGRLLLEGTQERPIKIFSAEGREDTPICISGYLNEPYKSYDDDEETTYCLMKYVDIEGKIGTSRSE